MAKKNVSAILWRRVNEATVDTLNGTSKGQYDIRLNRPSDLASFFTDVAKRAETNLGGFTLDVPVEAFEGANPVPAQNLIVRYMGDKSARRDWNIPSQRPATAYPLWREGRGLPRNTRRPPSPPHYVILARDTDGKFHARWLTSESFAKLPPEIKKMAQQEEVGVYSVPDSANVSSVAMDIAARLKRYYNILMYGPPGTGKTHIMQEVIHALSGASFVIDTENEKEPLQSASNGNVKVGWATFHQSYSYEEFIIGLRPDPTSGQLLSLVPVPGLLLELAEYARQPGNSSLLIIDEINRGNVSRIFGEFITLLEPDKRLKGDGKKSQSTVEVRLPYIKSGLEVQVSVGGSSVTIQNPFTMPLRLYTLASMNSVDKSIAPLDSALRRRFHIVNLAPDLQGMSRQMGLSVDYRPGATALPNPHTTVEGVKYLGLAVLNALNNGISFYLGTEYTLGQWYLGSLTGEFKSVEEVQSLLANIWNYQLLPQLEELFHGRVEQLATILRLREKNSAQNNPVYLNYPEEEMTELGAVPYLCRREVKNDDLITYLIYVAGVEPSSQSQVAEVSAEDADQWLNE
jgi:5-methylcytosine-specific restriction enzyme B